MIISILYLCHGALVLSTLKLFWSREDKQINFFTVIIGIK